MANDLITRLLLDSKQFDNNITKATREVQDFQKKTAGISKTVSNSFNSMLGVVGKIAPALGVAVGGYEAFNKVVNSSEGNIDAWGRTCEAAKASVDSFFISLNTGNFSNFLSGLGDVIKSAREAYDAIDDLGTTIAFQDVELSKLETKKLQLEIQIKEGKGGQEELKKVNEQIYALAGERAAKAETAYKASLKSVIQSETGGWYDAEMADYWSTWENFKTLSKADLARENQELEKRKQALGSQYDLVLVNYSKYKKMVESGAASEKVAQSVALVDATREYNVKKAILDQETKILEAKQYQITAQKALQSAYQSEKETLRYTADKAEKQAKSYSDMAKNVSAVEKLAGKLQGGWNIKINGKDLFDNNKLIDAIKDLPDNIAKALDDALSDIEAQQQMNNWLYESGQIDTGIWQKKNEQLQSNASNKISEIARQAFLVQGKKASKETTVPLLSQLVSWVAALALGGSEGSSTQKGIGFDALIDVKETYAQSIGEALVIGNPEQRLSALTSLQKNMGKDMEKTVQQVNGYAVRLYDAVDALFKTYGDNKPVLYDKLKELGLTDVENIKAPENGVFDIDDHSPELNKLYEKLSDYNDLYIKLGESIKKATQEAEEMQDMMDFASGVKSMTAMSDAISNTFVAAGEEETAFFLKTIGDITNMIAEYANLAVIKAAAGASSAPWPYTVAAIATAVTTTAAIVASAIQTFANGGIVQGGSYSGDRNLVRVNAGEMILNGSQQANLFRMLNGEGFNKSTSVAVTGTLKASGRDLIAVIGNTNNKYGKL